jgi:hypothetical protein
MNPNPAPSNSVTSQGRIAGSLPAIIEFEKLVAFVIESFCTYHATMVQTGMILHPTGLLLFGIAPLFLIPIYDKLDSKFVLPYRRFSLGS